MPRIQLPSVQQQTAQATQFSAPNVAPVQDATAQQVQGAGRALQQHGQAVSGIAADLQDEYDAALVNKADLAANEVFNQDVGSYLDLVGEPATGEAKKKAMDSVAKRIRAIEQGLGNDVQKELFQRATARRMQEWGARADRHERDQTRNFAFGMHTAKAQTEGMDAVVTVGTDAFLGHKEQMLHHVDSAADLQGLPEESRKLLRLGATTQMHSTVIDNMVKGGHATAASEYLAGAKGEIMPEQLAKLQGLVKNAQVDNAAQAIADDLAARGGSLLENAEQVSERFRRGEIDVSVRDRAIARLERDADRKRTETANAANEAVRGAIEWVSAGNALTPQQRAALDMTGTAWKYDAWVESGGAYRTTEFGTRELHTVTADELLRFNSADEVWDHYRTEMDNDDLPRMVAKWHDAQEKMGKASIRSEQQRTKDVIAARLDDEAEFYFMRLPESDPNWTEIPKNKLVELQNWKRAFRLEANTIAREKGLTEASSDLYKQAFESLTKPGRIRPVVGGVERTPGTMTPGQFEASTVPLLPSVAKKTGTKSFDVRLATPERLEAARDMLAAELNGAVELTEQMVYNRAAEMVADENQAERDVVRSQRDRGLNLMGERVRSMLNDPEVAQKAWRAANATYGGGLASPQGYRSRWDASLIQPTPAELERAFSEILMDSFGWKLADEFGIDRDEMWDSIRKTYKAQRIHEATTTADRRYGTTDVPTGDSESMRKTQPRR